MSESKKHLAVLNDTSRYVVERVLAALKLDEVDYWSDPNKDPPNLAYAEFKKLIVFAPRSAAVKWSNRTSPQGVHGKTGETKVFNVTFSMNRGRFRYEYYMKGYFYDEDNLIGVCIQSFRMMYKVNRQTVRILR